jgi:hypothetical protein
LDRGYLGTETYYYPANGASGQNNGSEALVSQLEFRRALGSKGLAHVTPFVRLDAVDSHRNIFDLRDAEVIYSESAWRFALGMRRVSWSVTEAVNIVPFQVVDILNQRDLAGDPAGQEKMGEAMITVSHRGENTLVELYLLPWFRARRFPSAQAREQPFQGAVDLGDGEEYVSGAHQHRLGAAARFERSFDAANVAFVEYRGYAPQPLITPDFATHRATELYYLVNMSAITVQASLGKWLLKTETAYYDTGLNPARFNGIPGNYWATVSGFEYTFVRAFGESDLGVIAEWMHDSRGIGPAGTPFPNDLFFGLRWVLNDQADSQLLGGVMRDLDRRAAVLELQYHRRIGTRLQLELILRGYDAEKASPLSALTNDELLQVGLHYFF